MIETLLSIAAALVVGAAFAMHLTAMIAARSHHGAWHLLEGAGAVLGLAGCAGVIGEWFGDLFQSGMDWHAETLVLAGAALWLLGFTRGHLCQLAARLQGWDGNDRRSRIG